MLIAGLTAGLVLTMGLLVGPNAGVVSPARDGADIYVAPSGSDLASGRRGAPLRTLDEALERAQGGQRIKVRPGAYPAVSDSSTRGRRVKVIGGKPKPRVDGAELRGATRIQFRRIKFTNYVEISDDSATGARARHIEFRGSVFTDTSGDRRASCIRIRDGAAFVRILRSRISNCGSGIEGPGNLSTPNSHHITIQGNRIERMTEDGIRFGHWNDVEIRNNVIRHTRDPELVLHNDGIQFFGDSRGVVISGNRIYDSLHGQLILIQEAIGPISDVLVRNNLIHTGSAYAIQVQGATQTRFINNTIWRSTYGGLLLRQGHSDAPAQDTVVVNNIIDRLEVIEGAATSVRSHNLIGELPGPPASNELVGVRPRFKRGRFNYRLRRSSPAVASGSRAWAPKRDIDGRKRGKRPNRGAFEVAR